MSLNSGNKVRIIAGPYTGWMGEVSRVEANPQRVTVVITVLGRSAAIDLLPWQIELNDDGGTPSTGPRDTPSDPDAPVRDPRRSGPSGGHSAVSVIEPEADQPADAIHKTIHGSSSIG